MATDSKTIPPPSTSQSRKILLLESITRTLFPNGVKNLILAYFLDKIVVTSEYYQAIYEGDLDFVQRVDREWSNYLAWDNDSPSNIRARPCELMNEAIIYDQMHVAAYFRSKIPAEKKKPAAKRG